MPARIKDMPRDPLHPFRAPDELWQAALSIARRRGEYLSQILRKALEDYVKKYGE
jgi:hypothetical protein